jgi:hypothetical protein
MTHPGPGREVPGHHLNQKGRHDMTYYLTWTVDGPFILTAIDGSLDLTVDQLMEIAFEIEGVEPGSPYEIASIIRATDADVIV